MKARVSKRVHIRWHTFAAAVCLLAAFSVSAPAQLTPVHGLYGGHGGSVVAVDSTLFLLVGNTLYASVTGGTTWERMSFAANGYATYITGDASHLFVGDDDGVHRSTDRGKTWALLSSFADTIAPDLPAVKFLGLEDSTLFVATALTTYRSTDYGDTWSLGSWNMWNPCMTALCKAGEYFFSGSDGVYRSSDRGWTWTRVDGGAVTATVMSLAAISYKDNAGQVLRRIFANTSTSVLKSTDGGDTWTHADYGLANTRGKLWTYHDSRGTDQLFLIPSDPIGGFFLSPDYGIHWSLVDVPLFHRFDLKSLVHAGGTVGASIQYGGFAFADSASHFSLANTGIESPPVTDVAHAGKTLYASLDRIGLYRSKDDGKQWEQIHYLAGSTSPYRLLCASPVNSVAGEDAWIYVVDVDSGLFRSTDQGLTWNRLSIDFQISSYTRPKPMPDTPGPTLLVEKYNGGLGITTDGGSTWTSSPMLGIDGSLYVNTSAAFNGEIIIATQGGHVYRSTDMGRLFWQPIEEGWPPRTELWQIARRDSTIYGIAFDNVLWRKLLVWATPDSYHWQNQAIDLPLYWSWNMIVAWNLLLLSTDHGLYRMEPGSSPVRLMNAPFLTSTTTIDSVLYAGTYDNGLLRGTLSQLVTDVDVVKRNEVPEEIVLEQNWPNPFNPATSIAYTVHSSQFTVHSTDVRLTVYDLLGREVATLVNERQAPGRYTVRFDGSRLASGVYYCRLQVANVVRTRAMLLVK